MNMNKHDAAKILNISGELTQEIIKQAYRKACLKFHPDRNPAGLEMMKAINVAYEALQKEADFLAGATENFDDRLNDAISSIINCEGLIIEVCGTYVWVSGDTKPHKDTLKANGFWWASKKMMWYWKPSDKISKGRGTWDIDKIRNNYGTYQPTAKMQSRIAA